MNKKMKQGLIDSINQIMGGLETIQTILVSSLDEADTQVVSKVTEAVKQVENVAKTVVEAPVVEQEDTPETTEVEAVEVDAEVLAELQAMTYNQLKKLAKDNGLDTTGKKDDLIARLLPLAMADDEEEATPEVVEAQPEEVTQEEVVEEVEEATPNTLYSKVERELAEYSVEELAEILESVGISPKGKRQALLSKICDAVEEGLLEFDTEEDAEGEEAVAVDEKPVAINPYFNPDTMTELRRLAVEEAVEDINTQIDNGEIEEEMIDDLMPHFYTDYDTKFPIEDKIKYFVEAYQRLIDDEGERHEFQEPYYIDEKEACCGHFLNTLENGNLHCEICGNEYEVE